MTINNKKLAEHVLDDIFSIIPQCVESHAPDQPIWRLLNDAACASVKSLFHNPDLEVVRFGPFGEITFPYVEMGAINSLDLFGMDELIIFAFYAANKNTYHKTVDFGTNIGLHTTIMSRCGFSVRSFEPDPYHIELLEKTIANNSVSTELHRSAVSVEDGELEFVRVLGNTTGSHLAGAKTSPYGDLERFTVKVEAAMPHLEWADLAKIDIEGHEAELITSLPADIWLHTDAILEVGTTQNAGAIYHYLEKSPVKMFSQKLGWGAVQSLEDIPKSHRDGSLFLTGKDKMPWGRN